jgi:SAM-dependent methyltransferase
MYLSHIYATQGVINFQENAGANTMTKSLDLGCGSNPRNPFDSDELFGIDIHGDIENKIIQADLVVEPIPFKSNSFEYVTAYDFLEHIPRIIYNPNRRNPFIELMNEIYRVLKADGLFLSSTPAYPHAEAFQDPTHVNIITETTFSAYFDDVKRLASVYGFKGSFKVLLQEWHGPHLLVVLKKLTGSQSKSGPFSGATKYV